MDFNFDKFLYIAAWVLAVGSTLFAILGAAGMYWYHNTASGKMELLRMRIVDRRVPSYRWGTVILAVFAWIAVFSFS